MLEYETNSKSITVAEHSQEVESLYLLWFCVLLTWESETRTAVGERHHQRVETRVLEVRGIIKAGTGVSIQRCHIMIHDGTMETISLLGRLGSLLGSSVGLGCSSRAKNGEKKRHRLRQCQRVIPPRRLEFQELRIGFCFIQPANLRFSLRTSQFCSLCCSHLAIQVARPDHNVFPCL